MNVIFLIGTFSFALSGYLVGVKHRLDLLGVTVLATLTAVGGGTLRDVLVGRVLQIFFDNTVFYQIVSTVAVAWVLRLHKRNHRLLNRLFIVADSIGLIAFSLAGAQIGIDCGLSMIGVAIVGFISAIGGGVVRDMLVNDVPFILHRDFYGSIALLVAAALYLTHAQGWSSPQLWIALLTARKPRPMDVVIA